VLLPVDCPLISAASLRVLAGAAPARPQTGPLPGAYLRATLPQLEEKLASGDYTLRDLEANVVELDARELANVNTAEELTTLSAAARRTS
jgi:molybdopterin-guanine dinucleotide biosynthesis protein A